MTKLFLISLLALSFTSISQTLKYDIATSKGEKIGDMVVVKTSHDDLIEIKVVSKVKSRIFVEIEVKYIGQVIYKNNRLHYSRVTTYVNDQVHNITTTINKGNYYTINKDGNIFKYHKPIYFSGMLLFFKEPNFISHLYSEANAYDNTIKLINKGVYQLTDPHTHGHNQYYYKNGRLYKASIKHGFISFEYILKP
ncbi:MAG TPA: hypothetical protein ENK64_01350 [Flavobacteriales bacterium]|nr:hypothetical protein [Flavobacteriales bacterium]